MDTEGQTYVDDIEEHRLQRNVYKKNSRHLVENNAGEKTMTHL